MAKKDETSVAVKEETALTVGMDYGEHMGQDSDAQDNSEIKIPFLKILQGGSPEVEKQQPSGAKMLDIYNASTGKLYDGTSGVQLIPIHRERKYVEWNPIHLGGGKVASHSEHTPEGKSLIDRCNATQDFGKWKNPDQLQEALDKVAGSGKAPNIKDCNDIIETIYVWALLVEEDESVQPVVLSVTSTKIKAWKQWIQMALNTVVPNSGGKKPPFFAHQIRLSTVTDTNDYGDFANIRMTPYVNENYVESLLPADSSLFASALEMKKAINEGMYRLDSESEASDRSQPSKAESEEEVPF